jgi:preprotein translocase subunit SecG
MFGFFIIINIIVCCLLIIVVLMQSSKGGGLAGTFGGAGMGAMFGVRRTADFLSKVTTVLAVIFVIITLLINFFFLPGRTANESVIQTGTEQIPMIPQAPQQSSPVAPIEQPPAQ